MREAVAAFVELSTALDESLEVLITEAGRLRDESLERPGYPLAQGLRPGDDTVLDRCHYCPFVDTSAKFATKGLPPYFSEEQARAVSLHYMHYNFAHPHQTLTKKFGRPTTLSDGSGQSRLRLVMLGDRRTVGIKLTHYPRFSRTSAALRCRSPSDYSSASASGARAGQNR